MNKNILLKNLLVISVIAIFFGTSIVNGFSENDIFRNNRIENIYSPFASADDDWDYLSNSPHMFSNVSGNVGIGTTNPSYKLDIRGNESSPLLNVYQNGTSRGIRVYTTDACALWVENSGNHGLRVSHADGDGIHIEEADGLAGFFNGKGYFSDKLGIGVIDPIDMLEVNGIIHSISGGFKFPDGTVQFTAATGGGSGNTLDQAYDQGGAGAGRTISADSGPVNIIGPDGLTISGNVGINKSNTDYDLEVGGDACVKIIYTDDVVFKKDGNNLWRMFGDDNGIYLENILSGKKYRIPILKTWNSYSVDSKLEQRIRILEEENRQLNERIEALESLITQK